MPYDSAIRTGSEAASAAQLGPILRHGAPRPPQAQLTRGSDRGSALMADCHPQ